MIEEWRDVKGFEGLYQVSNMGKMRSLDRYINAKSGSRSFRKGKMLEGKVNRLGYLYFHPSKDNKGKMLCAHILVMKTFGNQGGVGPIIHIDGNKLNNSIENLKQVLITKNDAGENFKECKGCHQLLPLKSFHLQTKNSRPFGYCQSCRRMRREQYFLIHPEKKQHHNKITLDRYYQNKEKFKLRRKIYLAKPEVKKRNRERERARWATDINFKLQKIERHRINQAIRGFHKSVRTQALIGCSVDFLRQYLESKFQEGMTWDNYGKWHIDHIRPCASFDLSNPEEQLKCFNYTNLQPLWAADNIRKSDNWDPSFVEKPFPQQTSLTE